MNQYYFNASLLLFSSAVTVCILAGNLMERGRQDACTDIFHRLVILNLIYNLMGSLGEFYMYSGGARDHNFYRFTDVLLSLAYYGLLHMFTKFLLTYISGHTQVSKWWLIIARIFVLSAMFLWFIYLSFADGPQSSGSGERFYHVSNIALYAYAVFIMIILLAHRMELTRVELLILMTFVILPMISSFFRLAKTGIVTLQPAITISVLLISNFLHMNQAKRLQEQEKELAEKQRQIMMSQIRPHFLFNVLNTIHILCGTEPQKAQEAINYFSRYLRANLDYLTGKEKMIPIRTELEHVDYYLKLEKMRYGDDLQIVRDIKSDNFWVPSLTVQPIVENAVKHGIHSRPEGGTITISTREREDYYEIRVSDDGKGFDPVASANDGKQHIGLRNVRERLNAVCGGRLLVDSTLGEGTVVRMYLPKRESERN